MKKLFLFLSIFHATQNFASDNCFIAKENNKIIRSEGECNNPYGPQSTFKIALSLIGFDSDILEDENNPSWSLPNNIDPYINICRGDHNPRTWMRDSCLWYSRILTNKLGIKRFKDYVIDFSYGNMDLSGGVENSWISNSLKISPEEQTIFLQKIIDQKLSIKKSSYDKTKNIMFIQEMAGGWKLYGKTGNGNLIDKNGKKTDLQQGWFVGYIEKGNRQIVFAAHIKDDKKQNIFASFRAKNDALIKLWYIIEELEK